VEPEYGTADEENPQNIARGEAFAAQVINAVMAGPAWERTLLIWTFDEHGGYYDHVPPPRAVPPDAIAPAVPAGQSAYDGFGRCGFRVPCAIVSPWARRHYVSHRVFDHASICKLVETKWNLPAMTYRDANAANMLDLIDLRRPAFRTPPRLAAPLLDTDPGALACDTSGPAPRCSPRILHGCRVHAAPATWLGHPCSMNPELVVPGWLKRFLRPRCTAPRHQQAERHCPMPPRPFSRGWCDR
jgi:phospholipase C